MPLSLNPGTFSVVDAYEQEQGTTQRKKPDIDVTEMDLVRLREQAWEALVEGNRPPRLFCYGDTLVRVVQKSDGAVRLEDLTPERLRYELADAANWLRRNKAVPPPQRGSARSFGRSSATTTHPHPLNDCANVPAGWATAQGRI